MVAALGLLEATVNDDNSGKYPPANLIKSLKVLGNFIEVTPLLNVSYGLKVLAPSGNTSAPVQIPKPVIKPSVSIEIEPPLQLNVVSACALDGRTVPIKATVSPKTKNRIRDAIMVTTSFSKGLNF